MRARAWLDNGILPPNFNDTNIVLLLKEDNQSLMKDYRSFSLCNVMYKIFSKVVANRLKSVLHRCVLSNKSTLVKGRPIVDNDLMAFEVILQIKKKKKRPSWVMLLVRLIST